LLKDNDNRLFRNWNAKGKQYVQGMGINMIADCSKRWATRLGLHDPEQYTSHAWKRSSGTTAADSGANEQEVKRILRHANSRTAKIYVKTSKRSVRKAAQLLSGGNYPVVPMAPATVALAPPRELAQVAVQKQMVGWQVQRVDPVQLTVPLRKTTHVSVNREEKKVATFTNCVFNNTNFSF
jgi:hypothetical protein